MEIGEGGTICAYYTMVQAIWNEENQYKKLRIDSTHSMKLSGSMLTKPSYIENDRG